jgi:hypothetical protein
MELIGEISLTVRRHDLIFVIVDTLTKTSHFFPVHMTHQVLGIARVYISKILRLPDVPKDSCSIRESVFARQFWTSFPRGLGNTTEL